jgi:membrane-bound ClpP family serine protease
MAEWAIVVGLISLGLVLVVVEILFVPGTTVVGVAGIIFTLAGVGMSYHYYGSTVGTLTFVGSAVAGAGLFIWSLKAKSWRRFSLHSSIDSKVNEGSLLEVKEGMTGKAVSALRPMGKAEIGSRVYEVRTLGAFVETGTSVKVVKVESNSIFVELAN